MTRFNRTQLKTKRARELRVNATIPERKLWAYLRSAKIGGRSFRRQHPVGPYILDFYCPTAKLAIELDGGQHGAAAALAYDAARRRYLNTKGIRVVRFSNYDLKENLDGVCQGIYRALELTPTRSAARSDLPLSGGGY
jgi:very-short-patch-repair endonuclease